MPPPSAHASTPVHTVLLDRDGVINQKMPEGQYVGRLDDLRLLPGVPQALARLNRAGVRVIVVSNQRGVALGLYTAEAVDAIHQAMQQQLAPAGAHIDAFFYCPHDKQSCACRKPRRGLFDQARARFPETTPENSIMIGDSLSDIQFGKAIGMRSVWIEGDAQHRKPGWEAAAELADMRSPSLPDAVDALLASGLLHPVSATGSAR